MKSFLLSLIVIAAFWSESNSQAIEVSGYGGYMFSGNSNYYDGKIDINNAAVYGGTLGYDLGNGIQVQFLYNRNSTDGIMTYYGSFSPESYTFDMVVEQYHLGAEKSLGGNEMLRPYGALSLGVGAYTPKNIRSEDNAIHKLDATTTFSMGAGLGVKIFPTEKLGFKLQGKLFMPLRFSGVGIMCGTGGCGGGSSFYVPIVHAELSAGVILRLEQ